MNVSLSLYKIADALQVPLDYQDGVVSGGGVVSFPPVGDLPEFKFCLTPLKIVVSEQVFVLFSVAGDLHLMVSHYPQTSAVSLFFIDGAGIKLQGKKTPVPHVLENVADLRAAIGRLKEALVGAFFYSGGQWKPLKV